MKYSQEALDQGLALIRPLWMLEPNDPACHTVDDEFSVGEELIVAPVLEKGVTHREGWSIINKINYQYTQNAQHNAHEFIILCIHISLIFSLLLLYQLLLFCFDDSYIYKFIDVTLVFTLL